MIDDPSTTAAVAGGAIRFPQKMRNFLRPVTPKRLAATYNQRLGAYRFMDCRVIRGNDMIRAHHRSRYFEIYMSTEDGEERRDLRERFLRILTRCFPEPLRCSKSRRYSYDLYNREAMSKSISHTSFYRFAASRLENNLRTSPMDFMLYSDILFKNFITIILKMYILNIFFPYLYSI